MTKIAVTMARQTLTEIIKVPVNTGRAKGGDKNFFSRESAGKINKKGKCFGETAQKKGEDGTGVA